MTMSETPPSSRASALRRRWLDRALESAGIDPAEWQPDRGVDVNRRTIERVYAYYGVLYLADARLEWAGMANLIGPSFYAGFQDVGLLPDIVRRLVGAARRVLGAVAKGPRRRGAAEEPAVGELGYFETTFLTMQRKIFEDQALMHEAYVREGIDAIRALATAAIVDSTTLRAWEQIDRGDASAVHGGNRVLLYREQHDIIDRFYVDMRRRRPPAARGAHGALPVVPTCRHHRARRARAVASRDRKRTSAGAPRGGRSPSAAGRRAHMCLGRSAPQAVSIFRAAA